MIFTGTRKQFKKYLREIRKISSDIKFNPDKNMNYNYSQTGKHFFGEIDNMIEYLKCNNYDQYSKYTIMAFIEALEETKKEGYYLAKKKKHEQK